MQKLLAVINLFIFSILTSAAEKIPFCYTTEISTTTLPIEWNEKWFGQQSSYEYNHGIARIACFMSAIAYDEKMLLENYRLLGISEKDMELHYNVDYSDSLWGNDQCAFSLASKEINSSKGKQTLVLLNIRGTPLVANEWLSNLNINDSSKTEDSIHKGFGRAASIIHTALISYLLRHRIDPTDSYILVTGHSRGAAVSNLLADYLLSDDFFKPGNCYVYTFASPNVTTDTKAFDSKYGFIWNIVNAEDIVPTVPFFRDNWHFIKFGNILCLPNFTNMDQKNYEDEILPKVNRYYDEFFNREYCPMYTGPFVPALTTRVMSSFVGNVESFYTGVSGLHGRAVNLMSRIFPPIETISEKTKEKARSSSTSRIEKTMDRLTDGHTQYIKTAFGDMHQIETYLSFMMVLDGKESFSETGYTMIIIEGAMEAAVFDLENRLLLRIVDGIVKAENQKLPLVAVPTLGKKILIGVPSNMEFEMIVTDSSVIPSPMPIWLEHFNSAGIYLGSTEPQKLYLSRSRGYKFKIGKETHSKPGVREKKLTYREMKPYLDQADLKAESEIKFEKEFAFNTNLEFSGGIHYGIPLIYGTALAIHNPSKFKTGFDIALGAGHQFKLYRRFLLDTELLAKGSIMTSSAGVDEKFNLTPELRVSLSRISFRSSSIFIAAAFDFHIDGFNDSVFDPGARKRTFTPSDEKKSLQVYPSFQMGIKF